MKTKDTVQAVKMTERRPHMVMVKTSKNFTNKLSKGLAITKQTV